jgi:hypothetical protein
LERRDKESKSFSRYFVFTDDELLFLVICIILDVSEYIVAVLLLPVVGDILDIVGLIACLAMFRWIGLISLFELVPGADILPIFIITWLTWYFLQKRRRNNIRQAKL